MNHARGMLAEYEHREELLAAIESLHQAGYRAIDAFSPYKLEEAPEKMGLSRSRIPVVTLASGLLGAACAYVVQWYTNAVDYPLNVAGFPLHSAPAWIPNTFETGVLFAGVGTFVAWMLSGALPRLWDPLHEIEGFERAVVDRFFVFVSAEDPRYDASDLARRMSGGNSLRIVEVGREEGT